MYDKQDKAICEYTVLNNDYSERVENMTISLLMRTINDEIAFCESLESYQIVEAYKKGQLKGKLQEIAAKLDAEDNPVIMLVKHKK